MTAARCRAGGASVAVIPGRDRLVVWVCSIVIAALAWAYLVRVEQSMSGAVMSAMAMSPDMPADAPRTHDVVFLFTMWCVMMVGMMSISVAPVVLLFAGAHAGRRRVPLVVPSFALGYAVIWAAFSALAAIGQWGMHAAAMLSPVMSASNSRVAGVILVVAGLYELTPIKGACLARCRSPLGFLLTHWRDGRFGALRMGMRHGLYCLGCCWALMGVLFAAGVMNLFWIAALMLLVLLQKSAPAGTAIARIAGTAMIVVGAAYVAGLR